MVVVVVGSWWWSLVVVVVVVEAVEVVVVVVVMEAGVSGCVCVCRGGTSYSVATKHLRTGATRRSLVAVGGATSYVYPRTATVSSLQAASDVGVAARVVY